MSEGHRSWHGVSVLQLLLAAVIVVVTTAMVVVVMVVVTASMVVVLLLMMMRWWCLYVCRRHWTHGRFFSLSQFAADETHGHYGSVAADHFLELINFGGFAVCERYHRYGVWL